MLIPYTISIVSFLASVVAGVAMVRRVRAGRRGEQIATPPEPSFSQHLHAAAEYGSVRSPRPILQQTVEAIRAKKAWNMPSRPMAMHAEEERVEGKRKAPQSATSQRAVFSNGHADWNHLNKDYGDLTDLNPSRPVGAASGRTASRRRY